ncbi:MAG: hypothetical protein WAW11_00085 [Patescibacteria group bacterium]
MATIQLPKTGKLVLNSNEEQWRLLANRLIPELRTSALVEVSPEREVKIQIVLQRAFYPDQIKNECEIQYHDGGLGKQVDNGMARVKRFLADFFDKEMWLLIGYIDGQNKAPILITYYPSFGSIYTQKLTSETNETFTRMTPSLN